MKTGAQALSIGEAAQSAGSIWYRLHSESEEIREALIREPWPSNQFRTVVGSAGDAQQLKQRLRLVNDALDRLMAGSFGSCVRCGQEIEHGKIESDPAIAFCNQCAGRMPTHH